MILTTDYLLITDKVSVSDMLSSSPDTSPRGQVIHAKKHQKLSERNLAIIKAQYMRSRNMYQRQLKNATYWGMAVDLAKEELKGGLQ